MNFGDSDKLLLNKFLDTINNSSINGLSAEIELWKITNPATKLLIKQIMSIDPKLYGFVGEEISLDVTPQRLIKIASPNNNVAGEYGLDNNVYLPKSIAKAFGDMSAEFSKDHPNRKLILGSGYRSPAFQTVILLYILVKVYDFDLARTLQRVAMPHFSQHCSVTNTAIDIINVDGQPSDDNPQEFSQSVEYAWLLSHADKYGFRESYPLNNTSGIMWEPWHWQYIK